MSVMTVKVEYGDFQTPLELAERACRVLSEMGIKASSLLEPTCGLGRFLKAGVLAFAPAKALAFDINSEYVRVAASDIDRLQIQTPVQISQANFFSQNWPSIIRELPEPLLVLGNPPWVTNAALGAIGSANLPVKSNFQNHSGLDAMTGKSNFDISEYMLIHLSEALQGRHATLAMLCKTAVARKVMAYCWKRQLEMSDCHIFPIDAEKSFGASVEACLFVASFNGRSRERSCIVHWECRSDSAGAHIGYRDGLLVSNVDVYDRWCELRGQSVYNWRSGIKHDCSKVMELSERSGKLVNGLGAVVEIEDIFLYPLLKSSALAGSPKAGKRLMLVTQREIGEDTSRIASLAPKTWEYLLMHGALLEQRGSVIYRNRPRFAIFGVGSYSFAPWKVAISGFYKRLRFSVIGPDSGKPVVLDDTSYFLPFQNREDAEIIAAVLNSEPAAEFYSSLIFWDAKRPITVDVLSQLKIEKLADMLGVNVDEGRKSGQQSAFTFTPDTVF